MGCRKKLGQAAAVRRVLQGTAGKNAQVVAVPRHSLLSWWRRGHKRHSGPKKHKAVPQALTVELIWQHAPVQQVLCGRPELQVARQVVGGSSQEAGGYRHHLGQRNSVLLLVPGDLDRLHGTKGKEGRFGAVKKTSPCLAALPGRKKAAATCSTHANHARGALRRRLLAAPCL